MWIFILLKITKQNINFICNDADIEFLSDEDQYKPVIFYNDFWNMKRDYHPINETVK